MTVVVGEPVDRGPQSTNPVQLYTASDALLVENNLSDVASAGVARTNLGLGTAATKAVGTASTDVAAGNAPSLAQAAATSAAATDATTKANAAQAAAISTASTDATTKANSAQSAAASDATSKVSTHAAAVDPHADRAYADGKFKVRTIRTIATHIAANPFYVGHRGSGGEFPEHTMKSYESAVAGGAQAIEVSVHITADGVPFCMHDTTLDRITDGAWTGSNATWTWEALNQLVKVKEQDMLGTGWTDQPIPTVREVLDRFVGKVVIFLEAKSNGAVVPLQNLLLNDYPGSQESVVWKNYYTSTSFTWAKANGFYVWAYTDDTTTPSQLNAVDANVDMWGVPISAADAQISTVVARGKPVMVWDVHRRSDVTRLTGLGVKGLMCAQFLYLTRTTAVQTVNDWSTKIKAPGNIGAIRYDPAYALKFDTSNSVYVPALSGNGVTLGSFCPIVPGASGYKLTFDMMFPVQPAAGLHAGLAFGKVSDDRYQFSGTTNATNGYHFLFRPVAGDMQLYTHTANVGSGTQLATTVTAPLTVANWASFEIEVNATQVILRRTDGAGWVQTTANTANRGLYFHLHNGSLTDLTTIARFRNLTVVAL